MGALVTDPKQSVGTVTLPSPVSASGRPQQHELRGESR
jgi:hypothetical protein